VITAIENEEPELSPLGIFIGPNPTESLLRIAISNDQLGPISFELYDMAGRSFGLREAFKSQRDFETELELNGPKGLYILLIKTDRYTLHKKIIKK
jgi:hypothetical protein